MKIVHVEGGLGNQMACYAVYIAAKEAHPNEDIYIDTYIYDVKEAHGTISMWNGYELETVFGIKIPDIRSLFTPEQISAQIDYLRRSEFWKNNWNYAEVFVAMMREYGVELAHAFPPASVGDSAMAKIKRQLKGIITSATGNVVIYKAKYIAYLLYKLIANDCGKHLLNKHSGDTFYDITLDFMKSPYLIEKIGAKVRAGLSFDTPEDHENLEYLEKVHSCESVSMHVRRTDYLQFNEDCYSFGYFVKATDYIKKQVKQPVFFVFSDDLKWCRENLKVLGLTEQDKIEFVDINTGNSSFRDMQIMSNCKHNIATKSSFGWWGSFLNGNPDKIVCMQMSEYPATNYF